MRFEIRFVSGLIASVILLALTELSASAQVVVDGVPQTMVIEGSALHAPSYSRLERAHAAAYDRQARIITRASVIRADLAPVGPAAPVFQLDPWSERRYSATWTGYASGYRYAPYGYRWYGYSPSYRCYDRGLIGRRYYSYPCRGFGYSSAPRYYDGCFTPYYSTGARLSIRIN
ncbi:MAG: hypothetical protein ACF8PN_16745 [Phycisphaerales bacterium]